MCRHCYVLVTRLCYVASLRIQELLEVFINIKNAVFNGEQENNPLFMLGWD